MVVLAGAPEPRRSTNAQLGYYTLALRALGHRFRGRAYGAAAQATTLAILHMQNIPAGDAVAPLLDLAGRLNRRLTKRAHTHRVRAEAAALDWRGAYRSENLDTEPTRGVPLKADWHTHRCPGCSIGAACFDDCEQAPLELRASQELYEPRLCADCEEHVDGNQPTERARVAA